MKIKISKSQWIDAGIKGGWMKEAEVSYSDIVRNHEIVNLPTRGRLHRCKACWERVDKMDNGFKSMLMDKSYPHAEDCLYKGSF